MRRWLWVLCAGAVLLGGCAPVAREPDDLALVRVLGVDGAGPVSLTAVCGKTQNEVKRGTCQGAAFGEALQQLSWSGPGVELALTGIGYLLVGPDVDLSALLLAVLEHEELGATITVWVASEGAAETLAVCDDPAADLELLTLRGVAAPTAVQAAAALKADGQVELPCVTAQDGRLMEGGVEIWREGG